MDSDAETTTLLDLIAVQGAALKSGAPGAREALLESTKQLHSKLLLPAENIIWTQWAQPAHTAALRVASETGLFEALAAGNGSPKSTKAIMAATNPPTEHSLVARMLRLLASMGTVVEVAEDTFAPTPLAAAMQQESFKEAVQFMHDDFNPCHIQETEYFKQNNYKAPTSGLDSVYQFATNTKGTDIFSYWGSAQPMVGKRFASMMQVWSQDRPKWFQEGYYPVRERLINGAVPSGVPDDDVTLLVDVGGGSGHDLAQLKQAFGSEIGWTLVLQDRPEVIALAEKDAGLQGIVKMGHDFFTEQPVKGARAYYFHSIVQDWNDEDCQRILRSIVPAMKPGYSKLLINDYVTPNKGAHWLQTSLDWELMAALGSKHRTADELRGLVESVGLKMVEIFRSTQSVDALIECELA